MHNRNNDFSLIVKLLNEFLSLKEIKKKLYFFVTNQINDWEKWFQIEFEFFLKSKKRYDVRREVTAYLNPKRFPERLLSKVDIVMSELTSTSKGYIFIEIKCTKRISNLKRGLRIDKEKVAAIEECNFDMRSFFGIGFHILCTPKDVHEMEKYVTETLKGSYALFKVCGCASNRNCQCKNNGIGVVLY